MPNHNQLIKIALERDDSPDFIAVVEAITNGLLVAEAPSSFALIKIDNWFGSKWLGFSGKILGSVAVYKANVIIPPFVPKRVLSEKRFTGPLYSEIENGGEIHKSVPSSVALTRRVVEVVPGALLFWYSGGSLGSGRGSAMAYIPTDENYCNWYAEWSSQDSWRLVKWIGIQPDYLARLTDSSPTQ